MLPQAWIEINEQVGPNNKVTNDPADVSQGQTLLPIMPKQVAAVEYTQLPAMPKSAAHLVLEACCCGGPVLARPHQLFIRHTQLRTVMSQRCAHRRSLSHDGAKGQPGNRCQKLLRLLPEAEALFNQQ